MGVKTSITIFPELKLTNNILLVLRDNAWQPEMSQVKIFELLQIAYQFVVSGKWSENNIRSNVVHPDTFKEIKQISHTHLKVVCTNL